MNCNIVVIGCGYWGKNHIKTLSKLNALYAVCDIDADLAESMARQYNVKTMNFIEILADKKIEGVILAIPPQFYCNLVESLMISGKGVFIEKPMALNMTDAKAMIGIVEQTGEILMVGHVLRFHAAFLKLEDAIKNNKLGNIKYIESSRYCFGKFHSESDAWWDLATHDLSLVLALVDSDISEIKINKSSVLKENFADFAAVNIVFKNGINSLVRVSRLSPYKDRKLTIVGDKAIAVFNDDKDWQNKLAYYNYDIEQEGLCWNGKLENPEYEKLEESMALTSELEEFIYALKNKTLSKNNCYEALKVVVVLTGNLV